MTEFQDVPASSLDRVERAALDWVRKSNPDLPEAEMIEAARARAATLPRTREPKPGVFSTVTMRERIARFVAKLHTVPATERRRISGLVGNEKRELFEVYSLTYIASSLTDYRAAVRDVFSESHPAYKYLHLNATDIDAINAISRAQVRYRQEGLRPIDPVQLVTIAERLIDSASYIDIGLGLALLTGRRPYEIYKSGAVELVDATHVRFVGQAKTKDAGFVVKTIPVLADAARIVAAWNRARAMPIRAGDPTRTADLLDSKAVNAVTAMRMKAAAVENLIADGFGTTLTPRDLRAAYAEIAFWRFATERVTKTRFFHEVLGHAEKDETIAASYEKFFVTGHLGDTRAANDRARRDLLVKLYRERNGLVDRRDRELRDERIRALESQLSAEGRDEVRHAVNEPIDPASAERATLVRALGAQLTATQARLVCDLANGVAVSLFQERRPLEILEERGLVVFTTDAQSLRSVGLTDLGDEVRNTIPPASAF